jgi:hypothetical protein
VGDSPPQPLHLLQSLVDGGSGKAAGAFFQSHAPSSSKLVKTLSLLAILLGGGKMCNFFCLWESKSPLGLSEIFYVAEDGPAWSDRQILEVHSIRGPHCSQLTGPTRSMILPNIHLPAYTTSFIARVRADIFRHRLGQTRDYLIIWMAVLKAITMVDRIRAAGRLLLRSLTDDTGAAFRMKTNRDSFCFLRRVIRLSIPCYTGAEMSEAPQMSKYLDPTQIGSHRGLASRGDGG